MAAAYGAQYVETLTGFKWIAHTAIEAAAADGGAPPHVSPPHVSSAAAAASSSPPPASLALAFAVA